MITTTLTPTVVLGGIGVLLALLLVCRGVAAYFRTATQAAQQGFRVLSRMFRVGLIAAVLLAGQWALITHQGNRWVLLLVLALPDLLASYALLNALMTTTTDSHEQRRNRLR